MPTTLTLTALTSPTVSIDVLRQAIPVPEGVEENRKFVEGDHWQAGKAWVGPGPRPSDPSYRDVMFIIEQAFCSKNVIDEIIDRHVSAMLGKEPRWGWEMINPPADPEEEIPEADQTAIAELEAAVTTWWDTRQAHRLLKGMIYRMLFGKRGPWRLYVPSGLLGTNGAVTATDLPTALGKLFLDIPEPENAGIWEDPETKTRVGIVIWKDAENKDHAEVTYVDPADNKTVIRVLPAASGQANEARNDFGGLLPMGTAELDTLWVSPQMRSLQKALNMTLTLLSKGLIDNAFLERLLLNALPPGHWEYEDDPDPETGEKIRKAYVPDRHQTGGRQTTYVQGIDFAEKAADGSRKTTVKDPSVVFREPVDPIGIIRGADYWYQSLVGEARQDHVLINKESTPSGKSREQARGDFIDSTKDTEMQTEMTGRTLLLTLVTMAEVFAGKARQWTGKYKPSFKCRPQYGPLSVEERNQNIAEAKDGFMADETAMALNGRDDVDAEQALIAAQPRSTLALSKAQAEVVDLWVGATFSRETSLHLAGFSDDEIKAIMKRESEAEPVEPPVDPNNPNPDPTKPLPGDPALDA